MKILIFTDNHFCSTSSIVRGKGEKYTLRLENQINSLNWVEQLAIEKKCDSIICAGDFFDKSHLTDIELTALKEIKWNDLKHYFIVGNHESSVNGLAYNSTKALESDKRIIVSLPFNIVDKKTQCHFVPYVIESDRKPLAEYLEKSDKCNKHIIFSHNDIKGIQMGPVLSKTGFDIQDILDNCDMYLNGHIHCGGWVVPERVCNLGSLTGVSFNENAFLYKHNVMILDTDTLKYELIENPHAFNFLSLQVKTMDELITMLESVKAVPNLVLSVKCHVKISEEVKSYINSLSNVIVSRLTNEFDAGEKIEGETDNIDLTSIDDHIEKFKYFILDAIGNTELVNAELAEICK